MGGGRDCVALQGYSIFEVMGMIEGFFGGFKCFDYRISFGRTIWQVFLGASSVFKVTSR